MEINIIYGKVQSGKSTYIYEKINKLISEKRKLEKENIKHFDKIYIITPEQFSFSTEKKLLEFSDGAIIDAEVLTFSRMADRLNNFSKTISKSTKAMIIYSIMLKNKTKLQLLDKTNENIQVVINAIDEFKKHNISVEDLKDEIEKCNEKLLKIKLQDLYVIYSQYEEKLTEVLIDPQDKIKYLAQNSNLCEFANSYIFIDEFNGFTSSEMLLIKNLILNSKQVNISFCLDDTNIYTNPDNDIYYDNKQNYCKLIEYLKENEIGKINKIPISREISNDTELRFLKNNLYSLNNAKYLNEKEKENLKILKAQTEFDEIEYVAKQITDLVKEKGYRYKDIAVALENLDEASFTIKGIFEKYNIPVFVDSKKQLNQNNITQYILGIFEVLNSNFSTYSVINLLKINVENDEKYFKDVCLLENYVKKWDLNFVKWKSEFKNKYEDEQKVKICNEIREKYIVPLVTLSEKLNNTIDVRKVFESVYNYLQEISFEEKVINMIEQFEQNNNVEFANTYKRSYEIVISIFDEIVEVLGDEVLSLEDIFNILKIGLENSKFAILPATLDQVLVGDIRRSKRDNIKVLFVLNANDGMLPKINRQEGFLNDTDRKYLKENNMQIAKGTIENLYETNFNIYRTLITPKDMLYVVYLAVGQDQKQQFPSNIVNKMLRIFPNHKVEKVDLESLDLLDINLQLSYENVVKYISTLGGLIDKKISFFTKDLIQDYLNVNDKVLMEKIEEFKKEVLDFGKQIPNKVLQAYKILVDEKILNNSNIELSAIFFENYAFNLTKQTIERLYNEKILTSISRLEKYVQCPFAYFLTYNLRVQPTEKIKVEKFDTGTFMHEVVEQFFKDVSFYAKSGNYQNEKHFLQFLEKEKMQTIISNIVETKLENEKNFKFKLNNNSKILINRVKNILYNSIEYLIYGFLNSDFYIYKQEAVFENGKDFNPIEIELNEKHSFELRGKIDRIDVDTKDKEYFRIIDYKSRAKKMDLNEVLFGTSLQLFTYLDAVAQNADFKSCAILYFPLIEKQVKKDEELANSYKMSGYVLNDIDVLKMQDNNICETKASKILPVKLNKDGNTVSKNSSVLTNEQFEIIQKYMPRKIRKIGKEIIEGNISINPHKTKSFDPCQYCQFMQVCNVSADLKGNEITYIPNKSDDTVINLMNKEISE